MRLACSASPAEEAWLVEQGRTINSLVCDSSVIRAHAVLSEEQSNDFAAQAVPADDPPLDTFLTFAERFFPSACRLPMSETEDFGYAEVVRRLAVSGNSDFIFAFEIHEAIRNGRTYLCCDETEVSGVTSIFPEILAASIGDQIND